MPSANHTQARTETPAWPALLRPDPLCRYLGINKVRLYDLYKKDPAFPRQVRLSNRCVGWRRAAIDSWLEAKEGKAA